MKTRRSFRWVNLLIKWEFQLFKQLYIYKDEQDFQIALDSLISHQQFQLISKLMSEEKKFSSQEIIELFQLGDKFLVSGKTKEKIFSLLMNHLSSENVENIYELLYINLWNESANRYKGNLAIEIDKCSIKLNGLRVSPEKKEEIFVLLGNLAKNYKVLYIRDIPLCSNDLKVIHSGLTELHIERCPFNFEEQLDLSQLTHLTHFTCSNCFADCHLLFALESITSCLEYLDVSINWINPIDHAPLVTWIEKQKSLKHLNLSKNNLNLKSAPTICNVLFNHPSLEVLNLSDNYLLIDFLEQSSSFLATLNWKSLSINCFDNSVMNSDLFTTSFSKLNQLEYLDMSFAPNQLFIQNFTSSLCKGISKIPSLKNFVFNTIPDKEYSDEIGIDIETDIENLFRKNPNLSLNLKRHTIKSYEDWKISMSHSCFVIKKLREIENIKNVAQSLFRLIKFRLDSSNNEPSQIEYVINKVREIEGVKLSIVHRDYCTFLFNNFDNFPPQPIQFRIIYETKDDLKNILYCCKNYFKSIFFHFQLSDDFDFDYPLDDFVLKYKNSTYWESIEKLKLTYCDIVTVFNIISEVNLPNLKSLSLDRFQSEAYIDEDKWSSVKNYSLQKLSLRFYSEEIYNGSLEILFKCIPNITEFKMKLDVSLSDDFPFEALPKGLRRMDIYTYKNIKSLNFLNYLSTFPLLTKLRIVSNHEEYSNLDLNMTIYLPNLTELITHQWIFKSARFVLPKLRVLLLDLIYESSLDNLTESKKLKSIQLHRVKNRISREIFDSDFLFSFSNLNEFYCDEYCYYDRFSYGLRSNKVSESLVNFTAHDSQSIPYSCTVQNGKELQKKNMPFLCKYCRSTVDSFM